MEQASQNEKFIEVNLLDVYNNFQLTDELIDQICEDDHNPYKDLMHVLSGLNSRDAQKMFLILQFTKERATTNYFAQILVNNGQPLIAAKVVEYNKTEVLFPYRYDTKLEIRRSRPMKSGYTGVFPMDCKPRGVVLIILNESHLLEEAKQIEYVFKEFHFKVIDIQINKTAEEIMDLFRSISQYKDPKEINSVITICIGHGQDEAFLGRDYNLRINRNDKVELIQLVDIFSEAKCPDLRDKPKVHIFNCCRIKEGQNTGPGPHLSGGDYGVQTTSMQRFRQLLSRSWSNTNINSTVIYSCAEGQESFFIPNVYGFTYFGRALTHTLAQFACQYHLDRLMTQVNYRLKMDERPVPEYPEVIHYNKMWEIYFNP